MVSITLVMRVVNRLIDFFLKARLKNRSKKDEL